MIALASPLITDGGMMASTMAPITWMPPSIPLIAMATSKSFSVVVLAGFV